MLWQASPSFRPTYNVTDIRHTLESINELPKEAVTIYIIQDSIV
jgi:hypothetical protein